ncbi:Two-component system protein A [Fusarium acuminatum]|uniref:Two-component system protein A n=1 Tax=Fusarium acuminatum TaxID=5515 RepID=A0ABZ2XB43_9HYPO
MDMVTKTLDTNVPAMSEIFDFLPVPTLVVSPSYRIQRASTGLLEAWGRRREELIDQDLFIALYQGSPTERFDRIPFVYAIETSLAARGLRLCYAAYFANGISWTARIMPVHRDDELLCLILEWDRAELHITHPGGGIAQSWLPIDDAFRILIQDVKDYAIFLLDTRGNVLTWNTGAELNKGYKREEIVGKHFSAFYGEADIRSRKPERELEICLREGRVEDEGWRYRKDGSRFWANVVITAIYKNTIHVGFGKVTRDLTERKEAELRLIAAYEESTKLKDDFLANISHEIRTPMHGVLSACSLLLDSSLTEEQRETANMIEESGRVLLRIINDILDYSKITAGSLSIKNDKVDIAIKLKKLNSPQQAQTVDALPDPSSELSRQEVSQGEDLAAHLAQLVKVSPTKRILAAEDNIINQKILVGMLHSFGFQHITVVSDGAQAVSSLLAAADAFDLILMDISMPVMNGYEATVRIRNSGIRLPIIAMTAYALKGDMERCMEKGMDDYIAKPMNRQLLMKKLLKWLVRPAGTVLATTA